MINWLLNPFKNKTQIEVINEPEVQPKTPMVFIHGANQSSYSWNYIREKLNHSNEILIDYSSMNRFYDNLDSMIRQIGDTPVFVVGHSLGGIYALHLLKHCNVVGGVTISTPFRGSSAADWAKFIVPQYPLFKDVGRRSKPIVEANSIPITVPWTQVVSTTGSVPYLNEANDGVCTIGSMEHRKDDMKCVRVEHTHYEVMCSNTVVGIIKNSYNKIK
jgi:pimeloyl-ACP methyl ester carboxylesterase